MMRRTPLYAAAALALAATPAHAQLNSNSRAPIDITADEQTVVNSTCTSEWRGAAEVLQENTRLRADVIKAFARVTTPAAGDASAKCGSTDRLEATGNVYYVTPQRTVRGDKAVYTAGDDTVVVTGGVVLVENKNVATGERLTLNNKTGEARLESAAKGPGKGGRVRGVFYPSEKPAQPAAQTPKP